MRPQEGYIRTDAHLSTVLHHWIKENSQSIRLEPQCLRNEINEQVA